MLDRLAWVVGTLSPRVRARRRHQAELLRIRAEALRDRAELDRQAAIARTALLNLSRRRAFFDAASDPAARGALPPEPGDPAR